MKAAKTAVVRATLSTLAMLAFSLLALTSFRWEGFAVASVALIGLTIRFIQNGPGGYITDQLLILAGFLVEFDRQPHSGLASDLILYAGIVLMLMFLNQGTFRRLTNRKSAKVANLPAARITTTPLVQPKFLLAAWTVCVACVGVSDAVRAPAWPVASLILLVGLATAVVVGQSLLDRLRYRVAVEIINKAVTDYQPEFVFYFSAPVDSEYHVDMWLPYLERLGKRFIIVTRENQAFNRIWPTTTHPVIMASAVSELENIVVPSLKAVFYANNGMKNVHMVRFNQLTHIQMLHGDSDKASSYNPVTAMFDRIYVAGQAGIDRYAANDVYIAPEKFVIVGRPQVEGIAVATQPIRDLAEKTVMYATTWSGLYAETNYSSLGSIGKDIVANLIERGATVIFRLHPLTRRSALLMAVATEIERMLADDRAKTGRKHLFGEAASSTMSLFECFNISDALISDVSGVASDFLFSEKPLMLTDMTGDGDEFAVNFPLARAAYVLFQDASNLDAALEELLVTDSLAQTRRAMKEYYLGNFPFSTYGEGFVQAAVADIDGGAATKAAAIASIVPAQRNSESVDLSV